MTDKVVEQKNVSDQEEEIKRLEKKIDELNFQHALDLSEITRLRRYVDFLIGSDSAEV